ncbi:MAG: hypothetical protein ACKKL4_01130 [Patescibacteria group bacterium]
MKRSIALVIILFISSTGFASARIGHCGDGNKRYTQSNHGDTVKYFADVNEFNISKKGDNTLIIEDTKKCRYGRDTLIDIPHIQFLDTSFTFDELITHKQTKELSSLVVRTFLFDSLAAQISNLGVDPFADHSNLWTTNTTSSNTQNNTSYSSSNTSLSGSSYTTNNRDYNSLGSYTNFSSSYTPGNYSSRGASSGSALSTYNDRSPSLNSYSNNPYTSYGSSNFSYTNSYSAYNSYTPTNNYGFSSNALSAGIPSASLGQITARWNTRAINPNAVVYIEAIDSNNRRHYLGSAIAGMGERTLDIPSYLEGEESLTIYIRSGSQVIDTFDAKL